jgi:hypothetical protein
MKPSHHSPRSRFFLVIVPANAFCSTKARALEF